MSDEENMYWDSLEFPMPECQLELIALALFEGYFKP